MTFEQQVSQAVQSSILKILASGDWLKVDWNNKISIPQSELRAAYDAVDMGRVRQTIVAKIEDKLADTIFHSLATELATDTKRILSNQELREDMRGVLRAKIRSISSQLEG